MAAVTEMSHRGQILDLIVLGRTTPEIAEALHLSVFTVSHHVSALIKQHGARDRDEVARIILLRRVEDERTLRVQAEQRAELAEARLAAHLADDAMVERHAAMARPAERIIGLLTGGTDTLGGKIR